MLYNRYGILCNSTMDKLQMLHTTIEAWGLLQSTLKNTLKVISRDKIKEEDKFFHLTYKLQVTIFVVTSFQITDSGHTCRLDMPVKHLQQVNGKCLLLKEKLCMYSQIFLYQIKLHFDSTF